MLKYLFKRSLIALPVLLGITLISYVIISLAPGDIVDLMVNPRISQADKEQVRQNLGLNDPIPVRYAKWLGQIAQGNLGYSFITRQPVSARIGERMGPTLTLGLSALAVAFLVAIPIGVISATRQYSWIDYASSVFALFGVSIPGFFLGMGLIYIFSLRLDLLPVSGMQTLGSPESLGDLLKHLVLPTIVLASNTMASVMRQTRSSMLDVVQQDFIRTATAKGLSGRVVIYKHALRNAMLPVITLLGLKLPDVVSGAIITEAVFQWPGIGRLTSEAIGARDYPVLMGLTLITAIVVVLGGLLADLLYSVADPRIRYS